MLRLTPRDDIICFKSQICKQEQWRRSSSICLSCPVLLGKAASFISWTTKRLHVSWWFTCSRGWYHVMFRIWPIPCVTDMSLAFTTLWSYSQATQLKIQITAGSTQLGSPLFCRIHIFPLPPFSPASPKTCFHLVSVPCFYMPLL